MIEYYKNFSLETLADEIWKDVPDYEGYYQISNLGRVKSLERWVSNGASQRKIDEKIRVPVMKENGYLYVILQKAQSKKMFFIHRLVIENFVGRSKLEIDHLDSIKTNNWVSNLEYVTHRENITRYISKKKSLPIGISRDGDRFLATIYYKRKATYLGSFKSPEEASRIYNMAVNDLDNIHKYIVVSQKKSVYGLGVYKKGDMFYAKVAHKSKSIFVGSFNTPEEAQAARTKFIESL